jgi:predicted methyltransferase
MSSTDEKAGEPKPVDKDYVEIIRSDSKIEKEFIQDAGIPAKIIYYCKDCQKIVKPKRIGKKFEFSCLECKGNNVAFGSEKSILNYYKNTVKK